jgi:hypothetical protein
MLPFAFSFSSLAVSTIGPAALSVCPFPIFCFTWAPMSRFRLPPALRAIPPFVSTTYAPMTVSLLLPPVDSERPPPVTSRRLHRLALCSLLLIP